MLQLLKRLYQDNPSLMVWNVGAWVLVAMITCHVIALVTTPNYDIDFSSSTSIGQPVAVKQVSVIHEIGSHPVVKEAQVAGFVAALLMMGFALARGTLLPGVRFLIRRSSLGAGGARSTPNRGARY
ncbi:MAG: hypothetical protein HY290_23050 [Planctomycetia bacterium]|nr:hypothetical protein [Planctomycetia bacterium]